MPRVIGLTICLVLSTSCNNAVHVGGALYNMESPSTGSERSQAESVGSPKLARDLDEGASNDLEETRQANDKKSVNLRASTHLWNLTPDAIYCDVKSNGRDVLQEVTTFGDGLSTSGANLRIDVDLTFADLAVKPELVLIDSFGAGLVLGINYVEFEMEMNANALSVIEKRPLESPFSALGVVATRNVPVVGTLRGVKSSGLSFDVSDVEGHFVDVTARLGLKADLFRLGAAYRVMMINADNDEEFDADITIGGPLLFAELAF